MHVDVSCQYFRDPEATRKAFLGGNFRTGDLAVMHPDGTVAIMDRSKDIIISGGEVCEPSLDFPAVSHRDLNRMPRVLPLSKVSRKKIDSNVLVPNRLHVELASHPHVLEVSVVARLHSKWGERPMAFVILHPQHATKWVGRHHEFGKDLKEHAKRCLPGFACPEWVEVVPELPVSRMT